MTNLKKFGRKHENTNLNKLLFCKHQETLKKHIWKNSGPYVMEKFLFIYRLTALVPVAVVSAAVDVVIVGAGLLVHFKKRKR
jgi:hypothetical protein